MALLEGQLDALRVLYERTLDRTCTVKNPDSTETRDSFGELTTPEETTATGVNYARMSTAGNERLVGASIAALGNYILRFKHDQEIEPTMTITDEEDGRVFQVVRQLDRSRQIGLRVLATES